MRIRQGLLASLVFATAACGGGGGSGNDSLPTQTQPCTSTECASLLGQQYIVNANVGPLFGVANLRATLSTTSQGSSSYRAELFVDGAVAASTSQCSFSRAHSACTLSLDTSTLADGVHALMIRVSDGASQTTETKTSAAIVQNHVTIPLLLSTQGIVPAPTSSPSGSGSFTANLATAQVGATVSLAEVDTVDEIRLCRNHTLLPSRSCDALTSFIRNPSDPSRWSLPTGTTLGIANGALAELLEGRLYVEARSTTQTYPEGVLQAPVLPKSVQRFFAHMSSAQVPTPVSSHLKGIVVMTIGPTLTVLESAAYDPSGPVSGTAAFFNVPPLSIRVPNSGAYWSTRQDTNSLMVGALRAGTASFVIQTAENPQGDIAAQLHFSPGTKLSELQTAIFTPKCSGCHDGTGPSLPGALDLRAGKTHASLIKVRSAEQASLDRVDPSFPAESYLVHKVEGVATMTGARMPLSEPPLSRDEIDAIRSWIRYGALDD